MERQQRNRPDPSRSVPTTRLLRAGGWALLVLGAIPAAAPWVAIVTPVALLPVNLR